MKYTKIIAVAGDLVAVMIILMMLFPYSLDLLVDQIGVDPHPISYFIGPALYTYGKNLIPNVDYFTQYGIGIGALFSYFLTESAPKVFKAAVLITLLGTTFFIVTFYLLARWVLESKVWALCLSLVALIMNFIGSAR